MRQEIVTRGRCGIGSRKRASSRGLNFGRALREDADERELVKRAAQWVYYYNLEREHTGEGMEGVSPWRKLRQVGVQVPV